MIDICLCGIAREDCDYHKPASLADAIPVHDVSGYAYIEGKTNFTLQNFSDALQVIWIKDCVEDFTLKVWTPLFHRLDKNRLLDKTYLFLNGKPNNVEYTLEGSPVVDEYTFPSGPVFDSLIYHADGRKVILRTREF